MHKGVLARQSLGKCEKNFGWCKMKTEKRRSGRLKDRLGCSFKFKIAQKDARASGEIFDVSSGGLKMLTKKFLKAGSILEIRIDPPLGPLKLKGKVIQSKPQWHVSDHKNELFSVIRVSFQEAKNEDKHRIIEYIYKCKQQLYRGRREKSK